MTNGSDGSTFITDLDNRWVISKNVFDCCCVLLRSILRLQSRRYPLYAHTSIGRKLSLLDLVVEL